LIDPFFRTLARHAAARYSGAGRFARHFAFGKLAWDPAFAHILRHGLIPHGSRILDLGCGQGLLAALLETARDRRDAWPPTLPPPPDPVAYVGIDARHRDIDRARCALDGCTRFVCGDIRSERYAATDVVVLLDVLHYLDPGAQDEVLRRARIALGGGGVLLMRIADASGTLRFGYTVATDRLACVLRRQRVDRLHCRPLGAWVQTLEALGFATRAMPMTGGPSFANVLVVARYDPDAGNEARPPLGVHDDKLPRPRRRRDSRVFSVSVERARTVHV
jgi:SAM-dependent methyltransferase